MFARTVFSLGASMLLAVQPLSAQDDEQVGEEDFAAMAAMFAAEPLTPEQEERLPAARLVVDRMIPPGAMSEVVQSTFGGFLEPLMKLGIEPSAAEVAKELGYEDGGLDLTEEAAAEAAAILDPVWSERREREFEAMKGAMTKVMEAMEPAMRRGMAEAYAVHFTAVELADVAAFFDTPSGAAYAKKSYTMASDPRIMSAAMESIPAMMEGFAAMAAEMDAATADLPARPTFDDLSADQRERLAQLTGLQQDEIAEGMALAQEQREAGAEFELEP